MSFDYQVVVRSRKRKLERIRALAAEALAACGAQLVQPDEEDEDEDEADLELRVMSPDGGGTIQVTRLPRGYQLSIDSNSDGNREAWETVAGLLDAIASLLGKIVEDEELVAAMLDERAVATPHELASAALLSLEDRDGVVVQTGGMYLLDFLRCVQEGGMLIEPRGVRLDPLLNEDVRYAARGARLIALLHGADGTAFRRHVWELDGYGRIKTIVTEEL